MPVDNGDTEGSEVGLPCNVLPGFWPLRTQKLVAEVARVQPREEMPQGMCSPRKAAGRE